jgi:hypothetical protein
VVVGCPRPKPTVIVVWGERLVSVASTSPELFTTKEWLSKPVADSVPLNVSVVVLLEPAGLLQPPSIAAAAITPIINREANRSISWAT